jgi:hypothetical protein
LDGSADAIAEGRSAQGGEEALMTNDEQWEWLRKNWTSVSVVIGVFVLALGLSGWRDGGGFRPQSRHEIAVGAALVAAGVMGRSRA